MKRILVALTLFSGLAAAQVQAPPPGSERAAEQHSAAPFNNAERGLAPSNSDIYCAGFVSKKALPDENRVLADLNPNVSRMVERGTIFLSAAGMNVGSRYSVVRMVKDPNHEELYPGQNKLLNELGNLYFDVGRVIVDRIEGDVAVATVQFTCDTIVVGDTLIPFEERPHPAYRTDKRPFERFVPATGAAAGRIVMGKDFDQIIGVNQKVYINLGASQGLKAGDYLRIARSYDPKDMPPVERLSLKAPYSEDTQKDPHPSKARKAKKLPTRGLGEIMILRTDPDSATAMVTSAVEDIHLGDIVEIQAQK